MAVMWQSTWASSVVTRPEIRYQPITTATMSVTKATLVPAESALNRSTSDNFGGCAVEGAGALDGAALDGEVGGVELMVSFASYFA